MIGSDPDLLAEAVECFDRGDFVGCLERIERLKAAGDEVPGDAWYFESLCLRQQGDLSQALESLSLALERSPDEPDYLLERGLVLIEAGRTQEGLDVLRLAVHASGHSPEFRHELYLQNALALYGEGYADAAVLSLQKAIKFVQDADTYRVLVQLLVELERGAEALEAISEGLDRFPRDAKLHHLAGLALSLERRPYEAAQAFVRAYELNPADPDPVHSLALIFETAGDFHRALETLERCLALELTDPMRDDVNRRISRIRSKMASDLG